MRFDLGMSYVEREIVQFKRINRFVLHPKFEGDEEAYRFGPLRPYVHSVKIDSYIDPVDQ